MKNRLRLIFLSHNDNNNTIRNPPRLSGTETVIALTENRITSNEVGGEAGGLTFSSKIYIIEYIYLPAGEERFWMPPARNFFGSPAGKQDLFARPGKNEGRAYVQVV